MSKRLYAANQRGDTIVEVLIAIAVVGSVLAITYSIMNRNLLTIRANQERTEATKWAQGQVEAIKSMWDPAHPQNGALAGQTAGFCVDDAEEIQPLSGGVPAPDSLDDDFADYASAGCQQGFYNLGVRALGNSTYKVTVRWDRIGGGVRQEASLVYRLE